MKRALTIGGVLVAVQLVLLGGWYAIEQAREAPPTPFEVAEALTERRLDQPAPPLVLRERDGQTTRLDALTGPALVHVWASWCPPCLDELPRLVAAATARGVPLVLVSVDRDWPAVDRVLDGSASTHLADPDAVRRLLAVDALPVTFGLDARGRLRVRLDGARDWRGDLVEQVAEGRR